MAVKLQGLGNVSVTTAGSRVQLSATSIITPGIVIKARTTNTGAVYVGHSNVAATTAAFIMAPGDAVEIVGPMVRGIEEEFDISDIYLDSAVNGEGVTVGYLSRRV